MNEAPLTVFEKRHGASSDISSDLSVLETHEIGNNSLVKCLFLYILMNNIEVLAKAASGICICFSDISIDPCTAVACVLVKVYGGDGVWLTS